MKKRIVISVFLALLVSSAAFSCGKNESSLVVDDDIMYTGEYDLLVAKEDAGDAFLTNEELLASGMAGSLEEYDYMPLIEGEYFEGFFEDYCDPENPLQLEVLATETPAAARPYKLAIVSAEGVAAPQNQWIIPVVDNGVYIGIIFIDCRDGEPDITDYSGGLSIAPQLNESLEKGSFALFRTGRESGIFAMFEDNSSVNLSGGPEYTGSLTFNVINQGYNLVTSDSPNDIVWNYERV